MVKKILTYGTVLTTIVWSIGLLSMPLAVGAAESGDLIKISTLSSVYYLGADSKRYVFPNEKTYFTWYSDFSGVVTISQSELESYPIGGNVTYKPGVKMVKITTDPKVYAVSANGTLRWVQTEALATELYDATWNQQIDDVPDAFFVNYTIGSDITAASDYDKTAEKDAATSINVDKGLSAAAGGTKLTVALAADTPASGIVVANAIRVPFTKINLTASADGDITVDSLTMQRTGTAAQDGAFSSIAVIDAATSEQIGLNKTLNSVHQAVLNDDIVVSAGTTKSIILAGNMASSLSSYAGEIPSLSLVAITLKAGATVSGTLPITGNYQTLNGTITIGTVTIAAGSSNPSSDATPEVGRQNLELVEMKFTINATEDVQIEQIKYTNQGSTADGDIINLELVDSNTGSVVTTLDQTSNKKAVFNLDPVVTIEKGKNRSYMLRADVESGSARTIDMDVYKNTDILVKGKLYGYYITPTFPNSSSPYFNAQAHTIGNGTLKVEPASGLASANIAEGATQVVLGAFDFTAKGEIINITSIGWQVNIATSSANTVANAISDLTNLTIYDPSGSIVAGPMDPTKDITDNGGMTGSATTTDTIAVPIGTTRYTVKGDLSSDFENNDNIKMQMTAAANITATGETTGNSITATPTGVQTSATMTVKVGSLSVSISPTPVAQTVVAGTQNFTFANLILSSSDSGEDIKISQIKMDVRTAGSGAPYKNTNMRLFDGTTELSVTSSPDPTSTTANGAATSTFTLTSQLTVTKGTSKTLALKGNISAAAATSETYSWGFQNGTTITAVGADTGNSITPTYSYSDGQTMTIIASGTLTLTKGTASPKSSLLPSNTSGLTIGVITASAKYEDVNLEKVYITFTAQNSGGQDQIDKLYLYDGSTQLAAVTPTTSDTSASTLLINITGSPVKIPKDSTKDLTLKVDTSNSNYEVGSKGASGQGLTPSINAVGDVTARGVSSGTELTSTSKDVTGASFNDFYLFKSIPVVTENSELGSSGIASGALASGDQTEKELYKFKVTANSAGDVGLYKVAFVLTTSTATITGTLILTDGTSNIGRTDDLTSTELTSGSASIAKILFTSDGLEASSNPTNVVPYTVSAGQSKTFTLKGDLRCVIEGGNTCSGSSGTGTISIQLLGDDVIQGTLPTSATSADDNGEGDFVWTDFWRTPALGTASGTASIAEQWSNGYLVKNASGGNMSATSTAVTFSK